MPGVGYESRYEYDSLLSYSGYAAHPLPWVHLGDLFFSGAPDDDGVEWIVEELVGWDSPDVRAATVGRSADDGLWLAPFHHGGRTLELKGRAIAPSAAIARAAKARLTATANLVHDEAILRVHEDRVRRVSVRRNERLLVRQLGPLLEFGVPLVAADHRKYSDTLDTLSLDVDEEGTATNEGDVATRPVATITGPIEGPRLVQADTGDELVFDVVLDEGDTIEVDFDLRTATSYGESVRSTLLSGYRWWELEPGDNVIRLEAADSSGAASVTFSWRSAWL